MRLARQLLWAWIVNVLALLAASWIVDGVDFNSDIGTLILAGLVFGVVNTLVKPIVKLLALPVIVLTLGLVLFVIDMFMLYLTSWIVSDFNIASFRDAVFATVIVWAVNVLLHAGTDLTDRRKGDR